jgi:hypothetical protein
MTKAGDSYQDLVAAVRNALDPGAEVSVGRWVSGPDGRRDRDVWVKGTIGGEPHRVLIECKDWKSRVGIGVVDALDSKRHDLDATIAAIYSNSGFTKPAINKARRVDIQLAVALKSGDPVIRVGLLQHFVARRLSVDNWRAVLYWPKNDPVPSELDPSVLLHDGKPLLNWLHEQSKQILSEHGAPRLVQAEYGFTAPQTFTHINGSVRLIGLVLLMECSDTHVGQTVATNVSLGHFDVLKGRIIIPHGQMYEVGPFDPKGWEPSPAPQDAPLEPGSFSLGLVLYNPIARHADEAIPLLDGLIAESKVWCPEPPAAA